MNNFLNYLNTQQTDQLEEIISKLISRFEPEKIYCFGSRIASTVRFSCFMPEQIQENLQFDLLMVTTHTSRQEPQEYINSRYTLGKVNILSHHTDAFRSALQLKHPFFIRVYEEGQLLYLAEEQTKRDPNEMHPNKYLELENNSQRYLIQAKIHLQLARQQDNLILTGICESVKWSCMALVQTYMQYYSETISLSRLINLCSNFTTLVQECFSQGNPEGIRLVHLLLNYSSLNDIRPEDIQQLMERAELFLKLQRICVRVVSGKSILLRLNNITDIFL